MLPYLMLISGFIFASLLLLAHQKLQGVDAAEGAADKAKSKGQDAQAYASEKGDQVCRLLFIALAQRFV